MAKRPATGLPRQAPGLDPAGRAGKALVDLGDEVTDDQLRRLTPETLNAALGRLGRNTQLAKRIATILAGLPQ